MFTKIDGTTQKYRMIKNENMGAYNLNTFFTFDDVFEIVSKYLKWKTEAYLNRELKNMEYPDRDKTHQLLNSSDKQLADKTILPRGILMYEINPMDDELVDIPTLNTHFDMNNGLTMELFGIRKSRLDSNVIKELDVYRDIDVSLYGNLTFTSALLFFTVLVDNRIEAIELQKQFKINFPIDNLHDIYKMIVKTDDTNGNTDNTGVATEEIELIPNSIKTVVPNEIIDKLKLTFGLETIPETDNTLEDILKHYSYSFITREVYGATRSPVWTTTYSCVPILVPKSIQMSNNVRNMKETSAVKIEFQLSYIEINGFKLKTKYKVLSSENKNNFIENKVSDRDFSFGVETLKLSPNLGNCVRTFELKLSYEKEDMKNNEMVLYLPDIVDSRDKYLGKFMRYLQTSVIEEDSKFYKVIVKHASAQSIDTTINSSDGTYFSYDDLCVYDSRSKVDDKIYVVFYINNELYRKWKIDMGYEDRGNLSAEFLRR